MKARDVRSLTATRFRGMVTTGWSTTREERYEVGER